MKKIKNYLLLTLGLVALTGCQHHFEYDPASRQDADSEPLKPASEYFDFNTTGDVQLSVNYGAQGNGALFSIYTEDPSRTDDEGNAIYEGEPYFTAFCDASGRFSGQVQLPGHVREVYVHTSRVGLPQLITAAVSNGQVRLDLSALTGRSSRAASPRHAADGELRLWTVPGINDLYAIVNWDGQRFGKIVNDQGLISEGEYSQTDIDKIQRFMWHGATSKPYSLDNQFLLTSTEVVNTTIPTEYVNEAGQRVQVTGAEVWITFLSEGARYQDGIGYYYYPTGQAPKKGQHLDRYLAIPNTSVPGVAPFFLNLKDGQEVEDYCWTGWWNYKYSDAPFAPNKRVQLLYHDPVTGEVSKTFPPGYTIGYFLTYKQSNPDSYNDETMRLANSFFYSNQEYNSDGKSRFMALTYNDKIIYGVEDGVDWSLEDILFSVEASPKGIVINEERPKIDLEELTATEIATQNYAYEDIWPDGGDYDLNDVIVEHQRKVTVNQQNYVVKVEDSFTPVQPSDAASYHDAFAIQIPEDQRGNLTLPEGAFEEAETGSIFLFTHAMAVRNKTFTVTRTFAPGQLAKKDLEIDLNPFIVSCYDKSVGKDVRDEIHLPKHPATSKANGAKIGTSGDAYFINKDGKHPFAICLPIGVTNATGPRFRIVTEMVNISQEYPRFDNWVETNGQEDADWYLHFKE